MPTAKLSLQNRIISLIIITFLLSAGALTIIQLNSQQNNINRYNSYRANLSGLIVKNNLEAILKQADPKDLPTPIQNSLDKLKESDILQEAIVFDREGKIIAATDKQLIDKNLPVKELSKWQTLQGIQTEDKWSIPDIDILKRYLYVFIPLKAEPANYIARLSFSLGNIQEAFRLIYEQVFFATIIIVLVNILLGYLLSRAVLRPIRILNTVTKIIAKGNLNVRTRIQTNDELQELGETFNYMAEELVKMKERAENVNPLTKLPGNIVIRQEVEKRIKNNQKFMVIYCDLDDFKAFNVYYGIAKGDEMIGLTADICKKAVKTKGNPADFIGHEGGDDFILLTTPEKAKDIGDYITREFNIRVRALYNKEDLERGHIVTTARDGSVKQFPVMTISLSGVSNEYKPISSYAQITNIAAEVKRKAKSIKSSVFVV